MAPLDPKLMKAIEEAGGSLPDELRAALLALDDGAARTLADLGAEDLEAGADADGLWAAAAARVELEATIRRAASEPLEPEDYEEALDDVEFLGADAVPILADAYAEAGSARVRGLIAWLAAEAPDRDDRLLDLLVDYVGREPADGADHLETYGDPRALPALSAALDRQLSGRGVPANLQPLLDAIVALGGALTPRQEALLRERAGDVRDLSERILPSAGRAVRPGRNDSCWCGSGKKYKKCHLALDDRPAGEHEAGGPSAGE